MSWAGACHGTKSISKKHCYAGVYFVKSCSAKMNKANSISLAAIFDAAVPRHRLKLYPQTAYNRAFQNPCRHSMVIAIRGNQFHIPL
jgi:hypothetical protein